MELTTQRLVIREYKIEDAKSVSKYSNNLNISKFMRSMPYPNTIEQATEYINKTLKDQFDSPRVNYKFGITLREDNIVIGGIALVEVDAFSETSTMGYWIAEEFWRKGLMFEATKRVIEFAFEELKLRRLNSNAHTENTPSNELLKKLGFVYEGTRIKLDKVKSTGELRDTNVYGLLKENWIKN